MDQSIVLIRRVHQSALLTNRWYLGQPEFVPETIYTVPPKTSTLYFLNNSAKKITDINNGRLGGGDTVYIVYIKTG